jgi:DNA-binding NarL/FixJ family response regulator
MVEPIRVLMVDPSVPARLGLRQILEHAVGLEVVGEAQDGANALELVQSLQADVVALESRLPDACGMEVVAEVRRRGLAARILAICSDEDDESVRGMLASGAAGYVLKNEPPEKIVEAVQAVAAGGAWYSQKIAAKMAEWAQHPPRVSGDLTAREVEILELLRRGMTNPQIAAELSIAESTVRFHLRNVYAKLGVKRRGEAIVYAIDQGIGAERLKETIAARLAFPTGRTSRKR